MGYLPNFHASDVIVFLWPLTFPKYDVRIQLARDDDGQISEVFGNLYKTGSVKEFDSEIAESLKDWCWQLSLQLQDGTPIEAVATRMRRGDQGEALSLLGAVVDQLCAEQFG